MKSLDNLVKTLNADDFKYTREEFEDEDKFHLMRKKGVFPYDFFDSMEKMDYESLPSRESFYNKLNDEECSINVSCFSSLFVFEKNNLLSLYKKLKYTITRLFLF